MELVEPTATNIKKEKNTKDLKESLQILQTWFSPLFPVGSFSYSHGLEAMINDNLIKSKEDILEYLKCILKYGSGKNDIILIKYAYQGEEINDLALSLCPTKERKIESIEMGNAFRKVLEDSWNYKIQENTAYPV
jgi:urease accessory protein